MAKASAKKPAPQSNGFICTCDRLPLASGVVLVRDQTISIGDDLTVEEAKNYVAAERLAHA